MVIAIGYSKHKVYRVKIGVTIGGSRGAIWSLAPRNCRPLTNIVCCPHPRRLILDPPLTTVNKVKWKVLVAINKATSVTG